MIVVILPNGHVILLMHLGDFPKPRKTHTFKFQAVPQGGIVNYIRKCFRRKSRIKKGRNARQHEDPRPNHVIWDYSPRGPAPQLGTATVEPVLPPQLVPHAAQAAAPTRKPRYRQATLPDCATGKASLLKDVHTKFIDRFPPVPSTRCEDFCAGAGLVDEWKYYQEVPAYHGIFQHLVFLNSFSYWDVVEAELR